MLSPNKFPQELEGFQKTEKQISLVSMPVGKKMAELGEWEGRVLGPDIGPQVVVRDEKWSIIGNKTDLWSIAQEEWSKMLKGWDRQYLWQRRE